MFNEDMQKRVWDALNADEKREIRYLYENHRRVADDKGYSSEQRGVMREKIAQLESIFGKNNLEQDMKPKIWSDAIRSRYLEDTGFFTLFNNERDMNVFQFDNASLELKNKIDATYKISKLIDIAYGGIVSMCENDDQSKNKFVILPKYNGDYKITCLAWVPDRLVAFHNADQAAEFLKHSENKLLLDLYYGQGFNKQG